MTAKATVIVTGDTYPHKDRLRRQGLRWDAARRGWVGEVFGDFRAPNGCTVSPAAARMSVNLGVCRSCGTVCYGDCGAN